jgi:RND family efflux transporter MFP subunit
MRRFLLPLLVAAAAGLAGCAADDGAAEQTETVAPLVQIVEAAPTGAAGAIRASGLVGYKRETQLAFTAPGMIASIAVDAGDQVRRGQRLAVLRRTAGGALDEAALARANAERDLARTETLFARGFVSQARLDDARLAVARASDTSALTAPTDGVILRRRSEPSEMVGAGAPVFDFGETGSGIVVRAPVASAAAARIRVGDAAQVRIADFAEARAGQVSRVGAKGDDATGAFEIEVRVTQTEGLRSGMVAEIEIAAAVNDQAQTALLIPTLSLRDARADQGVVFVLDVDGLARRRAVRTAGVTQAGVLVIEGLAPGERVIAAGSAYVRDGEPVRVASNPS